MRRRLFLVLLLMGVAGVVMAQKTAKARLVFTGVQNEGTRWLLCFKDSGNEVLCFDAKRSQTDPYVFFRTNADGSLRENEKIKSSWFVVKYVEARRAKSIERVITEVALSTSQK